MLSRVLLATLATSTLVVAAQSEPPSRLASADRDPAQLITETKHLKIGASSSVPAAAPGARVSLFVDVEPKPKMHVYAPDQKEYIPITVKITPDDAVRLLPIQFPKAETYFFEPLKETQRVYSKPFRIIQPVTLSRTATGTVTIKGTVRYQACDDAICYMPQEVPVSWTVAVKR
jgi:DsbC/DsbD-like thiol-disulfide interchange protein